MIFIMTRQDEDERKTTETKTQNSKRTAAPLSLSRTKRFRSYGILYRQPFHALLRREKDLSAPYTGSLRRKSHSLYRRTLGREGHIQLQVSVYQVHNNDTQLLGGIEIYQCGLYDTYTYRMLTRLFG